MNIRQMPSLPTRFRPGFLRFSLGLALMMGALQSAPAQPTLGDAPLPPRDVSGLPGGGPRPAFVTGNISVNTSSREQTREFYNAVYLASAGVAMNSTAVTADCFPGTNCTTFNDATLLRVNWFRAMAGLPAGVTFAADESTEDQSAALMMSENNKLQHTGDWTGWGCFSTAGTNASANSNLAWGSDGPDAITSYVWDYGANNTEVGHRRYIIYPQTQIMAAGDVPSQGTNEAANALWVFDANYWGSRPATTAPYVAWPPAGYAPYQIVFPQWSFALSNANLSAATVTMTSNGVPLAVTQQSYVSGYGENTLVWYPSSLNPASMATVFPFSGTDTVYAVTVSNVVTAVGTNRFSYQVTVFDPGVPGADYVPVTVSGTNQPAVKAGNSYCCTPATNPNTTGYQWLTAQAINGSLIDNAANGTTNFTVSAVQTYPLITNAPDNLTGNCFHLAHVNATALMLQLNEQLFPSNSTTVSFKSLLGYASTNEVARVQVSTNGGTSWLSLFSEAGTNGPGETTFTQHTLALSNYAGAVVLLRFNYDLIPGGGYYPYNYNYVGWCLQNIIVTNTLQLLNPTTNATSATNFTFTPTQTGNYIMQAQGVIFNQFPLDVGPVKVVTAIVGPAVMLLSAPSNSAGQVKINFALASGAAPSFHLLQASQLTGPWTTNGSAVLTTNVPGSEYQFTTTNGPAMRFYRVQTP